MCPFRDVLVARDALTAELQAMGARARLADDGVAALSGLSSGQETYG